MLGKGETQRDGGRKVKILVGVFSLSLRERE
jgi:hypothetical protein